MQDDQNFIEEIGQSHCVGRPCDEPIGLTIDSPLSKPAANGHAPKLLDLGKLCADLDLAQREIETLQEQRQNLEKTIKRMTLQTLRDDLTGLRNRHRFREDLESAWAYAVRQNLLLSIIVLDLDDFPSYVDNFGAGAGDQLLRHLAAYLDSTLRAYDFVARFGSAQFALLLPSTDRTDARSIAERIRKDIQDRLWPFRPMTASLGVATLECSSVSSRQFLEEALEAMREAKHEGGNRVTYSVATSQPTPTPAELLPGRGPK